MHIHIHKARRLSLALLTTALATSLLAACSNTHEQATPPPTSTSTTEEPTPTETIDRQARLEALEKVFRGYLTATTKASALGMHEGDELMRQWSEETQVGRMRGLFVEYRKREYVMVGEAKFTAHLAADPTILYTCMDNRPSKILDKKTGEIGPATDKPFEAWKVNYTQTDSGSWHVKDMDNQDKEAKKKCGM